MAKVIREDFKLIDGTTVVHTPTGTRISTGRYHNPADIGDFIVRNENSGPERDEYDREEILAAAREILVEEATNPTVKKWKIFYRDEAEDAAAREIVVNAIDSDTAAEIAVTNMREHEKVADIICIG